MLKNEHEQLTLPSVNYTEGCLKTGRTKEAVFPHAGAVWLKLKLSHLTHAAHFLIAFV